MIKGIHDLNREEKILLIQEIAHGNVDRDDLNDDTLIVIQQTDVLIGMAIASDNEHIRVVFIGPARQAFEMLVHPEEPSPPMKILGCSFRRTFAQPNIVTKSNNRPNLVKGEANQY